MGFVTSMITRILGGFGTMSLERWIRKAKAEQVMAYFMKLIVDGDGKCGFLGPTYTEQQLANFHENFDFMSISKSHIEPNVDQTAFSSFLSRHFQPSYPHFAVATPLIYKIALTHAAYPFSANPPDNLSADSLLRAVTMLTGRINRILPDTIERSLDRLIRPGRSERDICRLIFQSLAMPAAHVDWQKGKHLTDNDIADVHMVVSRAQPRIHYTLVERPWSEFLPMAIRLSKPCVPLADLRIPYEVLRQLLKLLLAVQPLEWPTSATRDVAVLDDQAVALLRAAGSQGEDVGFEGFEMMYERLGRREGRLENEMMDDLPVNTRFPSCPLSPGGVMLKPDLLQCLARVFEVFLAPMSEGLGNSYG